MRMLSLTQSRHCRQSSNPASGAPTAVILAAKFAPCVYFHRDAPPVRLSPNYPEPTNPNPDPNPNPNLQQPPQEAQQQQTQDDFAEEAKKASAALVKAAKQFDALVNALPLAEGGEKAQLKRIAELQAQNDMIGQELQRQLEVADEELKQVQELFSQASDKCLNMKKP